MSYIVIYARIAQATSHIQNILGPLLDILATDAIHMEDRKHGVT